MWFRSKTKTLKKRQRNPFLLFLLTFNFEKEKKKKHDIIFKLYTEFIVVVVIFICSTVKSWVIYETLRETATKPKKSPNITKWCQSRFWINTINVWFIQCKYVSSLSSPSSPFLLFVCFLKMHYDFATIQFTCWFFSLLQFRHLHSWNEIAKTTATMETAKKLPYAIFLKFLLMLFYSGSIVSLLFFKYCYLFLLFWSLQTKIRRKNSKIPIKSTRHTKNA